MKSNPRILIMLFAILSTTACLFLNAEKRGYEILDSIPVYDDAEFINESRTTYPDSFPSIIRTYNSNASENELLTYYQSILTELGWDVKEGNQGDTFVPKQILAEKDGWQLSVLVYPSGKFALRIFLD